MNSPNSTNNDFLKKLSEVTEANLTNPQFGVSMLAKEMGMGRHNLYRKVNSIAKITVSQFINHVRLKKAKEILQHTSDTVSEVAYKVGYNNVSYFIKCFHEYYGYSPGQVGNREEDENNSNRLTQFKNQIFKRLLVPSVLVVIIAVVLNIFFKPFQFQQNKLEYKIAILPPDNFEIQDSSYSTDIDGIIQSTINNLSKINEIKIVSPWQSVLQYRNKFKPAPEIAKERKVNYLVKPRIHSIQGKVALSFNLIDGPGDKHLEAFVHEIDSNNITTVHLKFLKDITDELDISITPAEQININKFITSNRKARNFYWKGVEILDLGRLGRTVGLEEAITYFKKALEYDNECASAYAQLAITYFYMDYHYTDQNNPEHEILYGKEINKYAEIAHQIDPQSDLSLIAKALYWRNEKEYEMAIDFLEDALDYNPNSYEAISNLYALYRYTENKEKSVEYALKIINSNLQIESTNKELGIERIYTQLSNQYRLLGFPDKALIYINEAIRINPNYTSASIIKSEIIADKEGNYQKSKNILERAINMDSTSINTLYRLGQWYYMLRDYTNANTIYNKWFELSGNNVKDYYGLRSRRLAFVYREMGEMEKAQMQINNYRAFGESINVAGRSFLLTGFYAFMNDTTNAIEQLKITSKYDHYYFRIRQLRDEPIYDNIRELPKFQQILSEMETRFNEKRDSIKVVFEKKRLL